MKRRKRQSPEAVVMAAVLVSLAIALDATGEALAKTLENLRAALTQAAGAEDDVLRMLNDVFELAEGP